MRALLPAERLANGTVKEIELLTRRKELGLAAGVMVCGGDVLFKEQGKNQQRTRGGPSHGSGIARGTLEMIAQRRIFRLGEDHLQKSLLEVFQFEVLTAPALGLRREGHGKREVRFKRH